jgi:hypothetical protein
LKDPNEELADLLTELDPPYETQDELRIGRMLDRYGIPFFYKQATIIYTEGRNELWKPSFTLYSYGGAVIDYVAGSDEGKQAERLNKDRIYRYNQIPATVLGPPDLDKPKWDQDLYAKLEQLYRRAFDLMRYTLADIEGAELPITTAR